MLYGDFSITQTNWRVKRNSKKNPRAKRGDSISGIIKLYIPNDRKDDSNEKEYKSRYKNTAIISALGLAKLSFAVVRVFLVSRSSHRDKRQRDVSYNKSDSYQSALATDKHHSGKKRHQYSGNEESVR